MMGTIKLHTYRDSPPQGEKWYNCEICGGAKYDRVDVHIDSIATEPTAGETITGATSGATGVVESYTAYGTSGLMELSSATGVDDDGNWGEDDEYLNGSVGGSSMAVANGVGILKTYGLMYPKSALIKRDGKYYCVPHYNFKFTPKDMDSYRVELDESIRSEE